MVFALTCLLCIITATLGIVVGVKFWIRPKAAIDRLRQTSAPAWRTRKPPKSSLRSLLDAAGRQIGSREKDR